MNNSPRPAAPATARFHRAGHAPLYLELARWLEQKVRSGEYAKGSRIPGDKQLAADLGMSVITVRAAMDALRDKHLIARYPGKGTFVLDDESVRTEWGLGSPEDLIALGQHTTIKLLGKGYVRPPEAVAAKFGEPANAKLFWCQTLRMSGGEPFEFTDVYLPTAIGSVIAKVSLNALLGKKRLVSTVVQDVCHVFITDIRQVLGAELARPLIAKMLKVPKDSPLLMVERDFFTADGTLVQVGRSSHRVDHYRYTSTMKRVVTRQP